MRNDDIRKRLNHELSGVHVDTDLHSRILLAAADDIRRRRRMGFIKPAIIAVSAVAVLVIALGVAFVRRPEIPDRVTAHGENIPLATAAVTPTPSPAPIEGSDYEIFGMWSNGKDGMFHLYEACACMEGGTAKVVNVRKADNLSPCPLCFGDCYWIGLGTETYHLEFDCLNAEVVAPVNLYVLDRLGYEPCEECRMVVALPTAENAGSIAPTPEPTPVPEEDDNSLTFDTEKYDGPAVVYYTENEEPITLSGWAAQNYQINWALTPGGKNMVFIGGAYIKDDSGEIPVDNYLEDPEKDYCWCTENGSYIHSVGNCSGMMNSFVGLIKPVLAFSGNKEICPDCGDGLGIVYCTAGGKYFHAHENCDGMYNSESHTRRAAYAMGKLPCPDCLAYESENPVE